MSIEKIEQISEVLGVHPVTIILAEYLSADGVSDTGVFLLKVQSELRQIDL